MANRLELHDKLVAILGSRNVYYQPPATVRMKYPAIVYKLYDIDTKHADDIGYLHTRRYQITLIDEDPDSEIFEKILQLPKTSLDRPSYVSDNLNHWVFLTFY